MDFGVAASYKVIVLGNSTVGKTTLIARLNTGEFKSNTSTTVGIDFQGYLIKLDNGLSVKLQIWDTAGQERFRNVTRSYYRGAHGVIYVYDVTNPSSFQDLTYWLESVKESNDKAPVAILLGNKNDMKDAKMIQKARGEMVRDRNTLYGFYEVSAKTGENVEKAFKDMAFFLVDNYNSSLLKQPAIQVQTRPSSTRKSSLQQPKQPAPNPFATSNNSGTVKLSAELSTCQGSRNSDCKCL